MLSVVVTVRPSGCRCTSPTSKSSKKRPCQPSLAVIQLSFPSKSFPLSESPTNSKPPLTAPTPGAGEQKRYILGKKTA